MTHSCKVPVSTSATEPGLGPAPYSEPGLGLGPGAYSEPGPGGVALVEWVGRREELEG